jgi:hypothetical protein
VTSLHGDKLAHAQCATETDAPLSCREALSLQNSKHQLHFQQTVAQQAAAEVRSEAAKLLRQVSDQKLMSGSYKIVAKYENTAEKERLAREIREINFKLFQCQREKTAELAREETRQFISTLVKDGARAKEERGDEQLRQHVSDELSNMAKPVSPLFRNDYIHCSMVTSSSGVCVCVCVCVCARARVTRTRYIQAHSLPENKALSIR